MLRLHLNYESLSLLIICFALIFPILPTVLGPIFRRSGSCFPAVVTILSATDSTRTARTPWCPARRPPPPASPPRDRLRWSASACYLRAGRRYSAAALGR